MPAIVAESSVKVRVYQTRRFRSSARISRFGTDENFGTGRRGVVCPVAIEQPLQFTVARLSESSFRTSRLGEACDGKISHGFHGLARIENFDVRRSKVVCTGAIENAAGRRSTLRDCYFI
jgi:hypothetical protein